jgi:hypothetical protein
MELIMALTKVIGKCPKTKGCLLSRKDKNMVTEIDQWIRWTGLELEEVKYKGAGARHNYKE